MAIHKHLANTAFGPEEITVMADVFREACQILELSGRCTEPYKNLVAKKIIEFAHAGESDPLVMCARSLSSIDVP